jgi:hypothetical protein
LTFTLFLYQYPYLSPSPYPLDFVENYAGRSFALITWQNSGARLSAGTPGQPGLQDVWPDYLTSAGGFLSAGRGQTS